MTPQPPRFNSDNSPETRETRRRAYEPFSGQNPNYYYEVPEEDQAALRAAQGPGPTQSYDFEHTPWAKHQRTTRNGGAVLSLVPHTFTVPEVAEASNVKRFPVERTRPPEPEAA